MSQRACLSCEVNDTKAEVKWYKDDKLITSSKTVRAESKGKTRQLVIDSVETKDGGEYVCEAGGDKLLFKIHVEGKKNAACHTAFDTFTVFMCAFFVLLCEMCTFFVTSALIVILLVRDCLSERDLAVFLFASVRIFWVKSTLALLMRAKFGVL